jgi:uncharacterized membrane protein SirB2
MGEYQRECQAVHWTQFVFSVPTIGSNETKVMTALDHVFDTMLPLSGVEPKFKQDHMEARERIADWVLAKYGVPKR